MSVRVRLEITQSLKRFFLEIVTQRVEKGVKNEVSKVEREKERFHIFTKILFSVFFSEKI